MTALQPGQMLGPYQITSQIGKGGMATVYKAYQAAMDRYVALKVVSGQIMDDPNFLKRFRQEVRMIANLEHPHILPVYDFGEADGTPYMVMRFLEAGTLTERMEAEQLSLAEVDRIFTQLTDALEYAHENGVIHRDIKPSNAMLDKRGMVFLTDFGIAKMVEGSAGLTATGAITGTPSYMSPEQAQGNKVDQRSDIYSLGIVLFEMLTGRVPFEAETPMAVLFKQILDPPPPLSIVRPDLPYTLEAVLLKAMAKKADDRYPSMEAFRAAWKNALAAGAEEAPKVVAPAPAAPLPVTVVPPPAPLPPVVTAPPAMTVPPPVVLPAQRAPVTKGFNFKWLLLGLPVLGVIACLLLVFLLRASLFAALPIEHLQATATHDRNQLAQATSEMVMSSPPTSASTATVATAAKGVTSWTAANSVYSIAFRGDEVLAAGMGGVTIWNMKDSTYKQQLTTANGLPSANTETVFVDTDGSLWAGSDSGVTHFQGDKATVYNAEHGIQGNNNDVIAIIRSGDRLLLGTQYSGGPGDGLLEFDGSSWKLVPGFPSDPTPGTSTVSYNVHKIATDASGELWIATDSGIAMLDGDQWHVFKTGSGLPDENVYTIYVDTTGVVWAGTANGGVAKYNAEKKAFESFIDLKEKSVYDVRAILSDKDGNLWFAGGNVARYNPTANEWTVFSADDRSFPVYSVQSLGVDDQGVVYFGSGESGMVRYINGKFEKLQVPNVPYYGQFGFIVPAPDGKLIFIQLYGDGADEFDPATGNWTRVSPQEHIPRAFDTKGQMWSGGSDGLWIFGADKTTHISTAQGLPSDSVNGIAFGADGTAYVATNAGVAVFDGSTVKEVYAAKEGLISDGTNILVDIVFVASDGSLWVGQRGAFSRRLPDGTWKNYTPENIFGGGSSDYFLAFVEDHEGNIWIPTHGDGLYIFSKDGSKPKRILSTDPGVGLPSDYFNAGALAPDGALWFGTEGQGAVRYDGKTWKTYGLADGLLSNSVDGIYIEPGGAVWFATIGGITRLEP